MAIEKVISIKAEVKQANDNLQQINKTIAEQKRITIEFKKELVLLEQQLKDTPKTNLAAQTDLKKRIEGLKNAIGDQSIALEELNLEQKEYNDNLKKSEQSLKKQEKTTKKTKTATDRLRSGVKALGTALKALGIGIIIAVVAKLTETLSKNQRVVDFVNVTFGTLGNIFSQIFEALGRVIDRVSESSKNFDGLSNVIGGLVNGALANLQIAFNAVKLVLKEAQLAWEQSFFGDKDNETIQRLQDDIVLTKDRIVELSLESLKQGKRVVDNFGDAVSEIGGIGSTTIEELSKVSAKVAFEQAKTSVEAKNQAQLAAAQQGLLVERYDRLAEQQRQIREEERNSIDERITANNRLGEVLEMQQKALLSQADLQIAAAQAEVASNDNIENRTALIEALANREGVLAQVEGFRSEQLVNDLALQKERLELTKSRQDAEADLLFDEKRFNAEREQDALLRLEKLKEINAEESEIELQRLQQNIENYKEGTQLRTDAEIEFLTRKQELAQQEVLLDDQINAERLKRETDLQAQVLAAQETFEQEKFNIANAGLNLIGTLAGKSKGIAAALLGIEKALAIAQVVSTAAKSIAQAKANLAATPAVIGVVPNPAYAIQAAATAKGILTTKIAAATSIATIIAQTVAGLGGSGGGSGGGVGGLGGGGQEAAPSFNVVGTSGVNQIAQTLNQQQEPVQAFVVGSNVTTQQELDRNIVETATLG